MAVAEPRRRGVTAPSLLLAFMLGGTYFLLAPNSWALFSHGGVSGSGGGGPGGGSAGYALAQYNVDTPTRRYGRQQKRGPVAALALVGEGMTKDELCYPPVWRAPRLAAAPAAQPPPCCNIMFNKRHRIIYLKAPKTAGTTLAANYFGLCGAEDADPRTCLLMLNYSIPKKVDMLLGAWDDWFVFGFSRNVLRRSISQYQYLSAFTLEREGCPRLRWDQHCADPYLWGDLCARRATAHCCNATASAEHQYVHAGPQADCFLTKEGQGALDWLGRVEHFEEDLAELVGLLNARKEVAEGKVPRLPTDKLPAKANYNASPCQRGGAGSGAGGGGGGGGGRGGAGGSLISRIAGYVSSSGSSSSAGGGGSGRGGSSSSGHGSGSSTSSGEGGSGSSSSGQGGGSSSDARHSTTTQRQRRLLHQGGWGWEVSRDAEHPCDKNELFQGKHAHCHAAIMSFYSRDLQYLMP